jgi:predicted phage gp36 major capsid-like protein
MSIRFAAPRHAIRNRMEDTAARIACLMPANDNRSSHTAEPTLDAALRHFARHGMAAAHQARARAQAARAEGDEQGFAWWLEICRALDRRMAREIDRQAV